MLILNNPSGGITDAADKTFDPERREMGKLALAGCLAEASCRRWPDAVKHRTGRQRPSPPSNLRFNSENSDGRTPGFRAADGVDYVTVHSSGERGLPKISSRCASGWRMRAESLEYREPGGA